MDPCDGFNNFDGAVERIDQRGRRGSRPWRPPLDVLPSLVMFPSFRVSQFGVLLIQIGPPAIRRRSSSISSTSHVRVFRPCRRPAGPVDACTSVKPTMSRVKSRVRFRFYTGRLAVPDSTSERRLLHGCSSPTITPPRVDSPHGRVNQPALVGSLGRLRGRSGGQSGVPQWFWIVKGPRWPTCRTLMSTAAAAW
jgi:hypothetical protein